MKWGCDSSYRGIVSRPRESPSWRYRSDPNCKCSSDWRDRLRRLGRWPPTLRQSGAVHTTPELSDFDLQDGQVQQSEAETTGRRLHRSDLAEKPVRLADRDRIQMTKPEDL